MSKLIDMYNAICKGEEFEGVDDFDSKTNAEKKIVDILCEEYPLNEKQARVIFNKAYCDAHSSGVGEVAITAYSIAEMVENIIELDKEA